MRIILFLSSSVKDYKSKFIRKYLHLLSLTVAELVYKIMRDFTNPVTLMLTEKWDLSCLISVFTFEKKTKKTKTTNLSCDSSYSHVTV